MRGGRGAVIAIFGLASVLLVAVGWQSAATVPVLRVSVAGAPVAVPPTTQPPTTLAPAP